jgi:predicted RNase H-like nuclease
MASTQPPFVGVDAGPDGWIAVRYDTDYVDTRWYPDVETLWADNRAAETILIDVPIGLRETSADPRPCDREARSLLGGRRASSVFSPPVRCAVYVGSYESAKRVQERKTDGSLGRQSYAIADRIWAVDELLLFGEPSPIGTIREAHPEVCFWALNRDETTGERAATRYSKTGQPGLGFWERVAILESVDDGVLSHMRAAGADLLEQADDDGSFAFGNDDLLDAFALALTASPLTGPLRTLPRDPDGEETDPRGLPMEMVYADPLE